MPIDLPQQLHFDPYHESGIVITRSPNRITMELPGNHFSNLLGFILGGIFIAIGITLSLFCISHGQWASALFGVLFAAIAGGMPLLPAFYFASIRATLDVTPDALAITHLGCGQDADQTVIPWNEITEIRIAGLPRDPAERPIGLLFALRGNTLKLELSGRPVGELERLQALLKSLIQSETQRVKIAGDD